MRRIGVEVGFCFGLFLMMCLVVPNQAFAADARDYIALPPGTNLFLTYVKHITGNKLYQDNNKIGNDFNLEADVTVFRYVHFMEIFGIVVDPQVVLPVSYTHLDGTTVGGDYSSTGMGDLTILATFWGINNPKTKTWLGLTPYLTMPTGDWDNNSPVNAGNNRWENKWELGFVQGFAQRWYFGLTPSFTFYGDNNDGQLGTVEKDTQFGLESHLSVDITKKFFVAADYVYANGGGTSINGVDQNDKEDNQTVGASLFFNINKNYQLMVQYKSDLKVKSGVKTNDFTARFCYVF